MQFKKGAFFCFDKSEYNDLSLEWILPFFRQDCVQQYQKDILITTLCFPNNIISCKDHISLQYLRTHLGTITFVDLICIIGDTIVKHNNWTNSPTLTWSKLTLNGMKLRKKRIWLPSWSRGPNSKQKSNERKTRANSSKRRPLDHKEDS